MSPSELGDQVRAAKPAAPPALRERVRALAARESEPKESLLSRFLPPRRFVLVAAPTAVLLAFLSAAVIGITRSGDDRPVEFGAVTAIGAPEPASTVEAEADSGTARSSAPPLNAAKGAPAQGAATLPPSGRLERYDAQMRIRVPNVDGLSRATVRAMQIARSLGGYVAAVTYQTPERGLGTADVVLRIPTRNVQTAVLRFSQLGTILSQRITIEDLQTQVDDLSDRVAELQRRIGALQRQLAAGNLTDDEKAVLQAQISDAQRELRDIRDAKQQTTREGRLATFSLSLTTAKAAAAQEEDTRLDRTLGEAKDILAWEAAALLYALVIVGPFVLLGTLVWLALGWRRRREEARLLERA